MHFLAIAVSLFAGLFALPPLAIAKVDLPEFMSPICLNRWANPNMGSSVEWQLKLVFDKPSDFGEVLLLFEDDSKLRGALNAAAEKAIARCAGVRPATSVRIVIYYESARLIAETAIPIRNWTVRENWIAQRLKAEVRAEEQKLSAIAKAKEDRKGREAIRAAFISKYGVQTWTNQQLISANPFPYRDKIVALRADFHKMISATEALFGDLIVTDINPTQFTRVDQPTVIAISIGGLRPMKGPFGEINLPYGKFVGAYLCSAQNCADFFDQ